MERGAEGGVGGNEQTRDTVSPLTVVLLLLVSITMIGCAVIQPILLRHPITGVMAVCQGTEGGAGTFLEGTAAAYRRQRDCVADYQRQGYERLSQ